MKGNNTNRVLMYTMIAIIAIATYITINSYYTQLAIYEEKEIFKLECIANAVAFRISGEEYLSLIDRHPTAQDDSVALDPTYQKIFKQLNGAIKMTKVPSEIYTAIKDSSSQKIKLAITSSGQQWLEEMNVNAIPDSFYHKGGMIGRFTSEKGIPSIGAVSLIKNLDMQPVGILQVNETFESFINKSRNQIYFNIIVSLIFISIIGVLMFFSVKNILRRQSKLAEERQELEQMRTELLANVSHDIRTPLSSIHGYVETLLMKRDSLTKEQCEKYLNTTLQSTEKLRTMVDELFELSKLENKERKPNIESFDIAEIMQDAAAGFKVEAQQKGVAIETIVPSSKPKVNADIAMIDRVLNNLISNAIKHCEAGDQITLEIKEIGKEAELSVTDTGAGISPEDLPHIFNRFHKGKTKKEGTGLGLAIVKSILDLHATSCKVESTPGKGTKFTFRLQQNN